MSVLALMICSRTRFGAVPLFAGSGRYRPFGGEHFPNLHRDIRFDEATEDLNEIVIGKIP